MWMRWWVLGVAIVILLATCACSDDSSKKSAGPAAAATTVTDNRALLCQDALQRRQIALQALATGGNVGDNPVAGSQAIQARREAERQRDAAEADVARYCDTGTSAAQAQAAPTQALNPRPTAPPALTAVSAPTSPPATPSPATPAPATPAPAAASAPTVTLPAVREISDPFAFCQAVDTIDWPVEDHLTNVRYTGPKQPFPGMVWRCWSRKVLGCETGATAGQCMTLDTSRTPSPELLRWCRENPGSAFIPFAVLGHGPKLYEWQCRGATPTIVSQRDISDIDALGYAIGPWVEIKR